MDDLKTVINKLKAFSFKDEMIAVITQNKDTIPDMQAEQLAIGLKSDGNKILPEYAPFTIQEKMRKTGLSGVYNHVTFYDTGELYSSLTAEITGENYDVKSPSFKWAKAIERSGKRIVGLTEANRSEFAKTITLPGVKKALKAKTGLVF